ncbi:MAG TPA: hypothetical protein V6C93_36785 [Allocoleopsis sp.]
MNYAYPALVTTFAHTVTVRVMEVARPTHKNRQLAGVPFLLDYYF